MSDIFISYAKEDKNRVKSLAHALERRGWSVWWDERIPAGQSYEEFIEKALKTAKSVVVVWTKTSVKSQWVKNEAKRGLRRNVLIPVMLLEEVEIPLEFEHLQAAHLMDWHPDQDHAGFDQFVGDLVHVIGAPSNAEGHRPAVAKGQEPPPAPAHENPPGTSTGRVGSKQSPPYLIIGAGLLVVVGAFVGQWFLSPIPSPRPIDPPQFQTSVQPPPTQSPVATSSPGPEPAKELPVVTPQAQPTTTQGTTATQTTATKPKPAAGPAKKITGKDGAPMVLIPAGNFLMGSTKDEVDRAILSCVKELKKDQQTCEGRYKPELPQHRVQIDSFYLDQYEVTNRLFAKFVEATGHHTTAEKEGTSRALVDGDWKDVTGATWRQPEGVATVFASNRAEHPVVSVSWEDADAYCRQYGKRLPTEAEFEYATRAGTPTKYWWGNGTPGTRKVANVADEFLNEKHPGWEIMAGYNDGYEYTAPVGSFEPNPFRLFDMTGNVGEWTADWFDASYYRTNLERNPKGPSGGEYRVLRGGSWDLGPVYVRSAYRLRVSPAIRLDVIGFRCALDVPK
jgi:sulfatase modifying factor 1